MPLRSGIRRTPLGALVVAALAIVLPVASGPLAAEAPIKAAPRPVDGAGRALYTFAHLPGRPAGAYAELSDLGFILELDDHGLVYAWLSSEEITKLGGLGIPWIELEDPARPSSRAPTTTGVNSPSIS